MIRWWSESKRSQQKTRASPGETYSTVGFNFHPPHSYIALIKLDDNVCMLKYVRSFLSILFVFCLVRVHAVSLTPRPLKRQGEELMCVYILHCAVNGNIVFQIFIQLDSLRPRWWRECAVGRWPTDHETRYRNYPKNQRRPAGETLRFHFFFGE
jgi:hypothetical protein